MTCSFTGMKQTLPRGGLADLHLTSSPKLFYFNMGHIKSQLYFLLLNSGRPQISPSAVDCGCGLKKEYTGELTQEVPFAKAYENSGFYREGRGLQRGKYAFFDPKTTPCRPS